MSFLLYIDAQNDTPILLTLLGEDREFNQMLLRNRFDIANSETYQYLGILKHVSIFTVFSNTTNLVADDLNSIVLFFDLETPKGNKINTLTCG